MQYFGSNPPIREAMPAAMQKAILGKAESWSNAGRHAGCEHWEGCGGYAEILLIWRGLDFLAELPL